jgi:DNA-binding transcriptional LysR family regulator
MTGSDIPTAQFIMQRVKSRQLLLLAAISQHRTLRKAAAALNTTQPAATKLLQDLELTLGQRLFERHRRGLQPNAFGDVMVRHALTVLTDLDRTREDLAVLATGGAGLVRVGAVPSAVPFYIVRAVARLKAAQPRLGISLEIGTSNNLIVALGSGELDILVARRWETPDQSDFAYEGSIDEPLVVAVRNDHPLTYREEVVWSDLVDWPWVLLPEGSPMRHVLGPLFRDCGVHRPANLVETGSMILMISLLQETDTLAVIPQDVLRSQTGRHLLTALPIRMPPIMGAYGILTRRDRPLSSGGAAFLDGLRAIIRENRIVDESAAG